MADRILALGKNSPRVKELRTRIRHRQEREAIIDGRRLLDDVISQGISLRELFVSASHRNRIPSRWIEAAGICFEVPDEAFSKITPTRNPQGVLAVVEAPPNKYQDPGEGIILYLETVQDPANIGAIIRSAAALGATAVWLSTGCADAFGPKSIRASAGAVFRIPVERNVTPDEASRRIRDREGSILATASRGRSPNEIETRPPLLLLFGQEGPGLSAGIFELADETVSIEMTRDVESLNIAVAAGILLEKFRNLDKNDQK